MIPAIIIDVSGIWNASLAAMAFGFGDIMLPAFPPPIMASNIAMRDKSARAQSRSQSAPP